MTEVTLEFIGRQIERVLDELLVTNARMDYVEKSMERLDAHMVVLTMEIRGLRRAVGRMNDRITKLEEPAA